jgi:hypothetical protein
MLVPRWFVAASLLGAAVVPAQADSFSAYADTGLRLELPAIGVGSFATSAAVLADGRLVAATGNGMYLESAVASGVFDLVSTFDSAQMAGSVDPSFLRVSPSGERLAVGGGFGKPVAVFDVVALGAPGAPTQLLAGVSADYFAVGYYDAAWYDDASLALTGGDWGQPAHVTLLDTTSDPGLPDNPIIVRNIGGSSAGIAFDAAGTLFTGNGFAGSGPSDTGHVKAVAYADWQAGLQGDPADFEQEAIFIVDLLSAGSLGFDAEGNFFVGGGDAFTGDYGHFALIDNQALADALAGLSAIDINDPAQVRTFDPEGTGSVGSYTVAYNPVTGDLYGGWADGYSSGDAVTWAVYNIPTPTSGLLVAIGIASQRRRRHA